MNLSHVERYFADFLSAMESEQHVYLHEDGVSPDSDWSGIPASLGLPANLFVIGTVNIDETTYMFSPKVLDRAHVIEFTVSEAELARFLESPTPVRIAKLAGGGSKYATAFAAQARAIGMPTTDLVDADGQSAQEVAKELITVLFQELAKIGHEFGYRPVYEIMRFLSCYAAIVGPKWSLAAALDAAISQKILPKLHGSKTKLSPVLKELAKIVKEDRYPMSAAKIKRMEMRLQQNGFTSYAEA